MIITTKQLTSEFHLEVNDSEIRNRGGYNSILSVNFKMRFG